MSKSTLNILTTVLGLAAGAATFLGNIGVINHTVAGTIGGIATAALGYLVQQPAVEEKPQTPQPQPQK
ncbi:Holin [Nostoc sp. DSM 114160]